MRVLAITDIHGKLEAVHRLLKTLEHGDFDGIFIAGDITHFSGADVALKVLEPLLKTEKPIVAVHGNCDGRDVPELLEKLGIWAHDRRIEVNGMGVVGIGGSNITPFRTIWELTEKEIHWILERNWREGDIILSHVPPYNTSADRVYSGHHVGSRALREFIEENEPPLVITGHIHEARSIDRIGDALIVNPGPLFRGYYSIVDLRERKAHLLEL
ncbi:MAG: uncharacterized protein PWQ79_696 [Thermococcaceae archaeon]|nr:uncharacterized protein [Thermococcaceae archaeon]